jgi:predicted acylesterase/phospholipase RssA
MDSRRVSIKNVNYNVLVLGPGGVKGYLELGAVYGLEKLKMLNNVKTFIGVSVGAIIALFLNVGISARDILYIAIDSVNFIDINSDDFNVIEIMKNIKNNLGIFSLNHMRKIITNVIVKKIGYVPTMKQLYLLTEKELNIVALNLSECQTEYINHNNYPELNCVDAVLLSINIPIIFWRMHLNGSVYIDGAFGDPYPVLLYDNGQNSILGIYVRTATEDRLYNNPLLYLHDVIHCLFHIITLRNIKESSDHCTHVELNSKVLDTIGSTLSVDDKAGMFLDGLDTIEKKFGKCGDR